MRPETVYDRRRGEGVTKVGPEQWRALRPRLVDEHSAEVAFLKIEKLVDSRGEWSGKTRDLLPLMSRSSGNLGRQKAQAIVALADKHGVLRFGDPVSGRKCSFELTVPNYCLQAFKELREPFHVKPLAFEDTEFCVCALDRGDWVAIGCENCCRIAAAFTTAILYGFYYELIRATFGHGRPWGADKFDLAVVPEPLRDELRLAVSHAAFLAQQLSPEAHPDWDVKHFDFTKLGLVLAAAKKNVRGVIYPRLSDIENVRHMSFPASKTFLDRERERDWNARHGRTARVNRDPILTSYNPADAPWNNQGRKQPCCGSEPPEGAMHCPTCGRRTTELGF